MAKNRAFSVLSSGRLAFSRMDTKQGCENGDVRSRIEGVLDIVRGSLALHNGGIEFVEFDGASGCLSLKFTGMCAGCPMANETLRSLVEDALGAVPEVRDVIAVPTA